MEILISTHNDISSIAKCQVICFPDSFAVKLGSACIEKSLQWFLANPNRFLVHVENNGNVIGFVGGFMPQFIGDGSKSGILNFAIKDAFTGLLRRPNLFFKKELWFYSIVFIKNKLRLLQKKLTKNKLIVPEEFQDYLHSVAITIIAVHTQFRGNGIVDDLLDYVEKFAITHNKTVLCLGVKQKNIIASRAYERNGWVVDKQVGDSFVMKKFLKNL